MRNMGMTYNFTAVGIHTADAVCIFEKHLQTDRSPEECFDICWTVEGLQKIWPVHTTPHRGNDASIIRAETVYASDHWFAGLLRIRSVVCVESYNPGREFVTLQHSGIFHYFRHTHRCDPSMGGTHYIDRIEYKSAFGRLMDRTLIRRWLDRMLQYRHSRMKELLDAPSWHMPDIAHEWRYWPCNTQTIRSGRK